MLVNLRDICAIAEQNNMAIASFNTPSLEAARAALDAAEQTGYPVILSHAEGHDPFAPLDYMGPTLVTLAERSSAMVCVHLDHCEHLSYMRRALEIGFTGAMFDGSYLPYEENVANSQRAADMCASFDAGLECELGSMGSREAGARDEGGYGRGVWCHLYQSRPGARLHQRDGSRYPGLLVWNRARHLQG